MALSAGTRLGPYEILEPLGAGGMGEVYRARDTKLGRDVALKVLPADSLGDESARRHFRTEAEALVRLSHPHIATIHDFDTADGTDFLVMELVRGHSVQDELQAKGALPEKTVVRLGAQLARGLQAAHEQGIVHRDLKPSNLQLTPDGLLKVLDFGLARLMPKEPTPGQETAPTQTAVGGVAGTLPYMSPEQLRGRGVDARTDLYAAGAVLYEMAAGKRLFSKPSSAELTDAILHEEPTPLRAVNERISPGLEAVVLKALDKDPELRHQTAKDLLVDLERLQVASSDSRGPGAAPAPGRGGRRARTVTRAAVVVVAILLSGAAAWLLWPLPPPRITNYRPVTGGLGASRSDHTGPHWATDGVRLYYVTGLGAQERLYQVPVTGGDVVAMELPFSGFLELYGYVAPESALLVGASGGASLYLVPVPAGAPRRVGALGARFAAPSFDGETLALVQSGRILLVGRDGSPVGEIGSLPTEPIRASLAPDGRRVRYEAPGPKGGEGWIWEVPVEGARARPLWRGGRGQWTYDGRYYVFERFDDSEKRYDLFAAREGRFPWSSAQEPARLTSGPLSFYAPGASPDGKRLFAWGMARRGELLRYDAEAERFEKYLGGVSAYYLDGSQHGEWLTWVSLPDETLWRSRADGSERLRLTAAGWRVHLPRWSPDGRQIVFAGCGAGETGLGLYLVPADGGEPDLLVPWDAGTGNLWDPCWLPDGESVVYSFLGGASSRDAGLSTEGTHPGGIYRVNLKKREATLLPGSEPFRYPKCSAQGDILAMNGPVGDAEWRYSVYSVDRRAWEAIGSWSWAYPNWSRDGETITAFNQNEWHIERWSRRTGRLEVVADLGEIPIGSWANAGWTGLAPDGSPLIMRDRSTRDLYALEWEAP